MNAVLPSVRRQHASLRIDTAAQSLSGWTELQVPPPASGGGATLGLHCYGLAVQAVHVNGAPVQFEVQPPAREELPEAVTGAAHDSAARQAAAVAEHCFYLYERQLQRERQPELTFQLPHPLPPAPPQPVAAGGGGTDGGDGRSRSSKEQLCIRVEFSGGAAGLRFWQQYACTDNQVRRASAWLPCVDVPSASVAFTLDVTCRKDQVAVGPGQLQRQSWADEERRWRTFHYRLPLLCAPCQLGMAVGPLVAEASTYTPKVAAAAADESTAADGSTASGSAASQPKPFTHFAPQQLPPELAVAAVLAAPPSLNRSSSKGGSSVAGGTGGSAAGNGKAGALSRSAHFFSLAFALFEELLGAPCPLPAMQQVFLPPELLLSPEGQVLAGLQVLSTARLIQPRAIEQSIAARCAMARSLARQWFGVLLRAASPLDEWLIEGLSGWLEEQYVRRYMGRNELAYRRWRERQAVFLADNGEAPPLAARGVPSPSPWGPLYGTERLDPSRLWSIKATAVVAMLEKRAGEELFRKHVGNVVATGLAALAAEQAAAGLAATPAAADGAVGPASAAGVGAGAGPSPLKPGGPGGEGGVAPTCLLDTMAFLNDLGRAGSFRKDMAPFAARWIYGRGVPHITAAFFYHGRASVLELALKQTGSESAKLAADIAQRAAVTEGSNAGIVKAIVREAEGDQYADHPVHLGGEAFVVAELKVTPVVEKKVPGRKPKRKKGEGEEGADDVGGTSGPPQPENPVRWVRLDPASELLCDIRLLQPERMLAAQLLHSRDVVAQTEAVQRLGELRMSSQGPRLPVGVEALRKTLHDRTAFYRVRCDAALALAGLRDDQNQAAGLPVLLDFYRGAYFHPGSEVPRTVAIADPSEYFVAQAVVSAVSLCQEPDGTTPIDALLFLSTCLNEYAAASGAPFSDYGLVAAMCASLGNVRFEGFGDTLLTLLEKFLERDAVLVSPGNAVGCACLHAMAALCANGTCEEGQGTQVGDVARRVRKSGALPLALRHAAMAATLQVTAAQRGPAAALQLALAAIAGGGGSRAASAGDAGRQGGALDLPAAATPAFLLEEAVALVTAANAEAASVASAAAAALGQQAQEESAPFLGVAAPLPLLQQLAGLLNEGQDCRARHLAFMAVQLLAAQPPTLYRPPPTEAEDLAAFLAAPAAGAAPAGQALSMGATHRTGGAQASFGTAAAAAAGGAAPKIRLQLPTGRPAGARSMGISGLSGPALSGEGPAMSDARMDGAGAELGEAVDQQLAALPPAAQGQLFSPARHACEEAAAPFAGFTGAGVAGGVLPLPVEAPPVAVGADIMAAFGGAAGAAAPLPLPPLPAPQVAAGQPPALGAPQQQQQPGKLRLKVGGASAAAGAGGTDAQRQQGLGGQKRSRTPSPAPAGTAPTVKRRTPPVEGHQQLPAAQPGVPPPMHGPGEATAAWPGVGLPPAPAAAAWAAPPVPPPDTAALVAAWPGGEPAVSLPVPPVAAPQPVAPVKPVIKLKIKPFGGAKPR